MLSPYSKSFVSILYDSIHMTFWIKAKTTGTKSRFLIAGNGRELAIKGLGAIQAMTELFYILVLGQGTRFYALVKTYRTTH